MSLCADIACMCGFCMCVQVFYYVQELHPCVGIAFFACMSGKSLCAGIACMCRHFWISMIQIPAHTDTYLHIEIFIHIVTDTECHYVVGIFCMYLQILHLLSDIPTDRFTDATGP